MNIGTLYAEIEKARNSDVRTFAESLSTFGLAEMALISRQAQSRLFFLHELDRLMQNPKTREQEIHTALENNLWVFGSDLALLTSNETLARTVQTYSGKAFTGTRAKMRPDLLLLRGLDGRHVLIEFKRPSHQLSRDDQNQAEKYRDDLAGTFNGIDILLLGGSFNPVLPSTAPKDVRFMSYPNIVSRARQELTWLLDGLAKHQVPKKTAVGPS